MLCSLEHWAFSAVWPAPTQQPGCFRASQTHTWKLAQHSRHISRSTGQSRGSLQIEQVLNSCIYRSLWELGPHMKGCQGKGFPLSVQICLSIRTWVIRVVPRIKIRKHLIALVTVSVVHSKLKLQEALSSPALPTPRRRLFLLREKRGPWRTGKHTHPHCSRFWMRLVQKGSALLNTTHFRLDGRSF